MGDDAIHKHGEAGRKTRRDGRLRLCHMSTFEVPLRHQCRILELAFGVRCVLGLVLYLVWTEVSMGGKGRAGIASSDSTVLKSRREGACCLSMVDTSKAGRTGEEEVPGTSLNALLGILEAFCQSWGALSQAKARSKLF